MDFVSINNVSYAYKATLPVVSDINWNIQRGQFHSLVGRSGCGKTTLLKIVAGLLNPTAGDVFIASSSVKRPSFKTGFVFQAPTLLEWLSVLENVLLPLSIQKTEKSSQNACGLAVLKTVGLENYANRHPYELSGGQQSRVAIARALITEPLLLLMDEPFAALDAMTREELQSDLLELCAEKKTTVLFVTHDISEAVYLSDKVAVMADGVIHNEFIIDINKPRNYETRYQSKFNSLCLDIRNSMKTFSPPMAPTGGL